MEGGRKTTHQIQMVSILEAIEQSDNPFSTAGIGNKGGRFENVPLRSNVALLTFTQHICLPELVRRRIRIASAFDF